MEHEEVTLSLEDGEEPLEKKTTDNMDRELELSEFLQKPHNLNPLCRHQALAPLP